MATKTSAKAAKKTAAKAAPKAAKTKAAKSPPTKGADEIAEAGTPMAGAKAEKDWAEQKVLERPPSGTLSVAEAKAADGRRGMSDAALRKQASRQPAAG